MIKSDSLPKQSQRASPHGHHHPMMPMEKGDGNYQIFRINRAKYRSCPLKETMYRVYKDYKKGKDGDVELEFVAMVYLINVIYQIYNRINFWMGP